MELWISGKKNNILWCVITANTIYCIMSVIVIVEKKWITRKVIHNLSTKITMQTI